MVCYSPAYKILTRCRLQVFPASGHGESDSSIDFCARLFLLLLDHMNGTAEVWDYACSVRAQLRTTCHQHYYKKYYFCQQEKQAMHSYLTNTSLQVVVTLDSSSEQKRQPTAVTRKTIDNALAVPSSVDLSHRTRSTEVCSRKISQRGRFHFHEMGGRFLGTCEREIEKSGRV